MSFIRAKKATSSVRGAGLRRARMFVVILTTQMPTLPDISRSFVLKHNVFSEGVRGAGLRRARVFVVILTTQVPTLPDISVKSLPFTKTLHICQF